VIKKSGMLEMGLLYENSRKDFNPAMRQLMYNIAAGENSLTSQQIVQS
jgi:hypothetical protein